MAEDAQLHPSGDPLLAAKFAVPAVPPAFVARQRLLDRLTEGARGPLTVITGPAGAGKTTLAASWREADLAPGPVVWLTVESDDNAPGVFWAYVLGAFRYHRVPLPDGVGSPSSADNVDHSLIVRLAGALAQLPEPVVLVLDGLEHAGGHGIAAELDFVLAHAGPSLRLVLIGRVDPALPLHRYRAEARVCEIRGSELAFTPRETAQLLRCHGLTPSRESVGVLTERTQGWAAGLRLCALAMQRTEDAEHFAQSFAASQNAVSDYLTAEVLAAQPAATQDLLVRTSILSHVHPGLADALTGRDDGARILGGLVRDNAFVEPIGDTSWYRCHPLFAEVLRAHLRSRSPALAAPLHREAACWLGAHDRLTDAIEHAAAADDWPYAAGLLVDRLATGRLLTGPEGPRLERLFSSMPDGLPGTAPALAAAACALARGDAAAGRKHLAGARPGRDAAPEVLLTRALLGLLTGADTGTGSTAPRTPAPAGGGDGRTPPTEGWDPDRGTPDPDRATPDPDREVRALMDRVDRALLTRHPEIEALRRYGRGRALLAAGHGAEAREAFAAALAAAADEQTWTVRYHCLGALALSEAVDGLLREAEAHARDGLKAAEEHGIPLDRRTARCHLALAAVAADRGDLAGAGRYLAAARAHATAHDVPAAAEAAVLRSRLELAHGRATAALSALDDVPVSADGPARAGGEAAGRIAVARCSVHLARGDPAAALAALGEAPTGGPAVAVATAAARLAAGDAEPARRLLAGLPGGERVPPAVRVRAQLLEARSAAVEGDTARAVPLVAAAVRTARPNGLRAPFTEAGPWLRHLLARAPGLADAGAWLTGRSTDAEKRSGRGTATRSGPEDAAAGAPLLVEQLSPRERDVLRCAAQTMSTDEIAAELFLSVNTVKTHLKSVYRKLSVSRRSEAVRRARDIGLL
ncbi:helix-turn-helix transcriptional regulator [Streptomyces sp. PKU-MA01144]|uniref:helix-turn-helix transcriptional regulator n=1 Tax=Streptomyces TaxID=1883 RepID=UPI00148045B1|nr:MULTISPECIES: LuxR C-terminal-related transcriptional regulator [Streptomyces]MCY0981200.1 LuxR C-terminal-related transcriptional regulator [Streptomyces tirandamycinicus]NNJ07048.1 helix-turn-helix transcriptional regulator [Streptomyces sp. PKU-MA01144]